MNTLELPLKKKGDYNKGIASYDRAYVLYKKIYGSFDNRTKSTEDKITKVMQKLAENRNAS